MTQPLSWSLHGNDQLSPVLEKLQRTLGTLSRKLDSVTGDAKQMGRALGESETSSGRAGRGLSRLSEHAGTVRERLGNLTARLKGLAATAAVALGAAGGAASLFGVQVAAANESAMVSFELLLGSAEKARKFLKDLQDFNKSTPFELPQLREAASKLLAVGVNTEQIIPLLRRLGDATAGVGTGAEGIDRAVYALGQMRRAGRVTLEDLNQLTDAGIPAIEAVAAHLGTTQAKVFEMVSGGKIKPDQVFAAILTGAGKTFKKLDGMMDRQSATLAGKLSNLKDTVSSTLGAALEPALPAIKRVLDFATQNIPKAFDKLGQMKGQVAEIFKGSDVPSRLKTALSNLAHEVLPALKDAWNDILGTIRNNKEGLEKLGRFISDVVIPLLSGSLVFSIKTVTLIVQGLIWAFAHAVDVIKFFAEGFLFSMGAMLDAATAAFGWVPGLGPKLKEAQAKFNEFANSVKSKLDALDGTTVDIKVRFDAGYADYRAGERNPSGRASGGPVWAGETYTYNELGQERLHMGTTGTVQTADSVRSNQASMASDTIRVEVVVKSEDGRVLHEKLLAFKRNAGKTTMGLA